MGLGGGLLIKVLTELRIGDLPVFLEASPSGALFAQRALQSKRKVENRASGATATVFEEAIAFDLRTAGLVTESTRKGALLVSIDHLETLVQAPICAGQ